MWWRPVSSWLHFAAERTPELWIRTGEHLALTGVSTGLAIVLGLPLGILASSSEWLRTILLSVIGVFQTIPSLAMLAILLTLMGKIGAYPAIAALTVYALLPIVRNTVTGIQSVPSEVVEAARGLGMTSRQLMWMVQLPLALPIVVAGIRTAAVIGVGIATLSAFIGAGGLGQFINRGLALSNTQLILLGAIPAAILAIIVDGVIASSAWGMQPTRQSEKQRLRVRMKPVALALPLVLIGLGVLAAVSRSRPIFHDSIGVIRIGSKNFTEQLILGELMAQIIDAHTDLTVDRRFNLGGTMICHEALVAGEIDLYAEYTGTGLVTILKQDAPTEAERVLSLVRDGYQMQFDAVWLEPFGFNNTYALTVRKPDADEHRWKSISDLAKEAGRLRAGFTAEFSERADGYPGLRKTYDLEFAEVHDLEPSLMYQAIATEEVDVICAFTTDGRIVAYDLQPLADDRHFFPPYVAAAVIRRQFLTHFPDVRNVLTRFHNMIDDKIMQELNYAVDEKGQRPAEVAHDFLKQRGLLESNNDQ